MRAGLDARHYETVTLPVMAEHNFDRRSIPAGAVIGACTVNGWSLRTLDWAPRGDPRGTMLVLGGRGDFLEKYIEPMGHWHSQGWHIASFDWRGQGGSGRLTRNPLVGHINDLLIMINDLAAIWSELTLRTPGPHVVVAHSMGGHLALRALVEHRIDPVAAVLVAPMLGLNADPLPPRVAAVVASVMARICSPERPAWRSNERPSLGISRQKLLTHSLERYADEIWWGKTHPELVLGPPSWQWLRAAYRSTLGSFAPGRLEGVEVPSLLLCADHDRLVRPRAIHEAAARMRGARLVRFGAEAAHELLREADPVRHRVFAEIDMFLKERAPRP